MPSVCLPSFYKLKYRQLNKANTDMYTNLKDTGHGHLSALWKLTALEKQHFGTQGAERSQKPAKGRRDRTRETKMELFLRISLTFPM